MIQSGTRVLRGPDWKHGNEDGGAGYLGTVLEVRKEACTCQVQWDTGTVTVCRVEGDDGESELRIYDNKQTGIKFEGITCDGCQQNVVYGLRWKCVQCREFDLCTLCYMADKHDKDHDFIRFTSPQCTAVTCPPRKRSKRIKIHGLGPGAEVKKYQNNTQDEGKVVEMLNKGTAYGGVAKVQWSNRITEESLIVDGKSDLVMVTPFFLGFAYPDHLPLVDLKAAAESVINVGDRVQINMNVEAFKRIQADYGGYKEEMEKIIGEIGTVKSIHEGSRLCVYYHISGRPWFVFRGACTKVSVVEKDDVVRVVENIAFVKNVQSTGHGGFSGDTKKILGKLGQVFDIDKYGDLLVEFPEFGKFCLSPSVCVKQYDIVLTEKDNSEKKSNTEESDTNAEESGTSEGQTGMVFDIGIRVVRGPNWNWGEQDGGEGCLGTVTEIGHNDTNGNVPPQCAAVHWDHGYRNTYRVGFEKQFDLRIFDTSALGNKHEEKCQGEDCPEPEIFGLKWQCEKCPEVYLCNNCYHSDKHSIMHAFVRYDYPGHEGHKVPKRQVCARVKLTGMFEGATVVRGPDWRWENQDGGEKQEGKIIAIVNFSLDTDRDGAEVTWNNGHSNVYRLGFKGAVDLNGTQCVSVGCYYRDHLPIFKLPECTKLGPSQQEHEESRLKRDDVVKIGVEIDILQSVQKEANAWNDRIFECIGQTGKVLFAEEQMVTVDFNGQKWRLHEMTLTKVNQFKAEEIVRLSCIADDVRRLQNGHGPWEEEMKKYLGKKGKVIEVDSDGDVMVTFGSRSIKFNPECLEPAKGDVDNFLEKNVVKEDWEIDVKSAFSSALGKGDNKMLQRILSRYPDLITSDEGLPNLLLSVCEKPECSIDVVKVLVQFGADLNQKADHGPPLLLAVRNKRLDIVEFLLEKGAHKDEVNKNQQSAVHIAVQSKDVRMLKLLQKFNCSFNQKDILGDNPVTEAITLGHTATLDVVMSHPDIDLRFENMVGFTPIHTAARMGEINAVMEILKRHPDQLNRQKNDGYSPLHLASGMNHVDIVKFLLSKEDVDTELLTKDAELTAVLIACTYASVNVLPLLIQARADLTATDRHGNNALHLCLKGKPSVMEFSKMQKGESEMSEDMEFRNRIKIMEKLHEHGVSINQCNKEGKTPREVIVSSCLKESFDELIKSGVCNSCEEEEAVFRLFPCKHSICIDCGGKRCKTCPVDDCSIEVTERNKL